MRIMNKFVKRELEKINDLLPCWDDNTLEIIIPRDGVSIKNPLVIGNKFTIKIENYIINQPPNFDLSENWNSGTVPPEEILDVEIVQTMGKMTKVKAIGKCTRIAWEGWLPNKSFRIQ